jgi:putative hydrolase of the HAD superfamily
VVSGALESTAVDIEAALRRVGLDRFISGYFCRGNTGFQKPDPRFYLAILAALAISAQEATMVGDSLEKDILPCHGLGMYTVLIAEVPPVGLPATTRIVGNLAELC